TIGSVASIELRSRRYSRRFFHAPVDLGLGAMRSRSARLPYFRQRRKSGHLKRSEEYQEETSGSPCGVLEKCDLIWRTLWSCQMTESLPKAVLEAADVSAISQLVLRERFSRDHGLWEQMRDCFHDDSIVRISWIRASGPEFVRRSI